MACGGAQRVMVYLTKMLIESGHTVTLTLLRAYEEEFFAVDARVKRTPALDHEPTPSHLFNLAGRLRRFKRLRGLLKDTDPEVVISFEEIVNVDVLIALLGTGVPVLACEHSDIRHHKVFLRWDLIRRLMYPHAAAVVVVNDDMARWCATLWPPWPLVTIPNPIEALKQEAIDPRPSWFASRNLVALGRLVHEKGFDLLIESFRRIADRYPEWSLTIFGEGPERPKLEEQVRSAGLIGRVHLPGRIVEPMRVLPHADAFVLSSRYEVFGMALIEAMSLGLPVVSFACPSGPPTIVRDGVDGLLVSPGSPEALADAMSRIMDDPGERERLGMEARAIQSRFSPETVSWMWADLLARVVPRAAGT